MRPGFVLGFTPSTINPNYSPPPPPNIDESYEAAGGWPGTIADPDYYLTYVINPTASIDESYEADGGWPGT